MRSHSVKRPRTRDKWDGCNDDDDDDTVHSSTGSNALNNTLSPTEVLLVSISSSGFAVVLLVITCACLCFCHLKKKKKIDDNMNVVVVEMHNEKQENMSDDDKPQQITIKIQAEKKKDVHANVNAAVPVHLSMSNDTGEQSVHRDRIESDASEAMYWNHPQSNATTTAAATTPAVPFQVQPSVRPARMMNDNDEDDEEEDDTDVDELFVQYDDEQTEGNLNQNTAQDEDNAARSITEPKTKYL
mmetsp:Transcript_49456/g.82326  ORF Transcript_49456/g.82326 Transcript_49456/m.82326 type:complete len:243 (+) Transcript_49456:236-964(+)